MAGYIVLVLVIVGMLYYAFLKPHSSGSHSGRTSSPEDGNSTGPDREL